MSKKERSSEKKKRNPGSLIAEMREHKVTFTVYIILRMLVIAAIVISVLRGNYENVFVCVLTLVLLLIPQIIERSFKVNLPDVLEVIILLFVFAAEILGELQCYYIKYPYWDTMLHTINGFICAAAGFALVDVLNRNEKIKLSLSPIYMAIVAFCFSMTVGVLWEFFEFGCDRLLLTDMQKDTVVQTISSTMLDPTGSNKAVIISDINETVVNGEALGVAGYLDVGLYDTMKDLFVNFIGAVVFSVIGFIYVKNRGKKKSIAALFIPTLKEDDKGEDDTSDSTKTE